ncbi:protein Wnt-11-like [Ptychodera flava]|uniref:protein Wnt-11-like n=1 Tax=Ptychodera flava TaxID=63121 RepID=UPI00396A025C
MLSMALPKTESPTATVFFIVLLIASVHFSYAIKWLALAEHEPKLYWNSTKTCKKAKGLVSSQVKLCRRNLDAMEGLVEAAELTKETCQEQFSDRRWNCSSINRAPDYTPDLDKGTRESAYVYALSAAAVAYSIAIECSSGSITKCGCGRMPETQNFEDGFRWGGCSDNVEYGMDYSSRFADSPLRMKKVRSSSKSLMNLHNNYAGLLTVRTSTKRACKCHGLSGACNLKTCWESLPEMSEIGSKLKRKYAGATEVTNQRIGNKNVLVPRDPHLKRFTEDDLIYLTMSPDYCMPNHETGSVGTEGRFCNRTSIGNDGCELMCCGRGYKSMVMEIVEQCQCRYHWCCYVKCKDCRRTLEVQVCK